MAGTINFGFVSGITTLNFGLWNLPLIPVSSELPGEERGGVLPLLLGEEEVEREEEEEGGRWELERCACGGMLLRRCGAWFMWAVGNIMNGNGWGGNKSFWPWP
jgi:hypothetical protein